MRVHLAPDVSEVDPGTGIGRVVIAQYKYFPKMGIELVKDPRKADVVAVHTQPMGRKRWDVVHCHGLYWTGDPGSGIYSNWHDEINKRLIDTIRKAKLITVPSEWVAMPFRRDMRINPLVVGHGIDIGEWSPGENKGYLLWNKNRNTDVCDPRPAWEMANRGLPVVSTFAPDIEYSDLPNYKITGRLPFDKMKIVISQADIYLATTQETFGIGILEAMACGIPVLGYAHGGVLDIVDHKIDGYLAQPGDLNDLEDGYQYIKRRRAEMGAAARAKAERYDWPIVIEKYADAYRQADYKDPDGVAVVIPCHNYADWVVDCVNSILGQSHPVEEIIVVNDGSSDNSLQVLINNFGTHPKVKIIHQENQGVAAARNNGIKATKQPFIICLDADDQLDRSMVKVCRDAMVEDPGLGIAYTGLSLIRPWGTERYTAWPPEFDWDNVQARPHNPPQNCVPSGAMFRRSMWERAGGYHQSYAPAEDAEFWTRGLSVGFTARKVSNEGLFYYRLHPNSASRTKKYRPIDAWLPWMRDKEFPIGAPSETAPKIRSYSVPLISVIVPVGPGHKNFLESVLECILGQTFRNWEIIVINDTGQALELDRFPFVNLIETKGRAGAGAARNLGIMAARAPTVMFLDADDYLLPNALDLMLDHFAASGGRYVYSDWMDANGTHRAPEYEITLFENFLPHAVSVVMATEDAREIMFDEKLDTWEDWDFFIRCAINGIQGRRLPVPLLFYRYEAGSRRQAAAGERRSRLRESINGKYKDYFSGEKEMGRCCGGSRAAQRILEVKRSYGERVATLDTAEVTEKMAENGTVRLEYIGKRSGAVTYYGTKKHYRFGNNPTDRYNDVDVEDVPKLLSIGDFRIVNKPKPGSGQQSAYIPEPAAPDPQPEPKPEPEPEAPPELESEPEPEPRRIEATPKALELAAEFDVNLLELEGSGQDGKILVSDVRSAIKEMELA